MTNDDIPAEAVPPFLRIPQAQRNATWARAPPRPYPKFHEPKKNEDPATTELRKQVSRDKDDKKKARFAALKARTK